LTRRDTRRTLDRTTQEAAMDFIERIFDIAPDGGDGSLEFLLFALPIAGLCWLAVRRHRRNRDRR